MVLGQHRIERGVKMKKLVVLSLCLILIGSASAIVYNEAESEDVMIVEADVLVSSVGIDVPDNVEFGEIAKGYISDRQDLDIKNTGTTDISVIPLLDESYSEGIFDYITLSELATGDPIKIGSFEFEIEKPSSIGGTKTQRVYMYLDLTEFEDEITENIPGHNTNITFWAIPI
jgi:hypothetical protein